jgi:putative chitinase
MTKLWPHGDQHVSGLIEAIVAASAKIFSKYGLDSRLAIAHAMAQFSEECGAGIEMVENLNYSATGLMHTWPTRFDAARANDYAYNPQRIADAVYNGRMGNRANTDDGWNYRGRGLSQTTGRDAYSELSDKLGIDFVGHPELVNDPSYALEVAVADFIVICGCLPWAKADNVREVTEHLNGGLIGLPERERWLAIWKKSLGVG